MHGDVGEGVTSAGVTASWDGASMQATPEDVANQEIDGAQSCIRELPQ